MDNRLAAESGSDRVAACSMLHLVDVADHAGSFDRSRWIAGAYSLTGIQPPSAACLHDDCNLGRLGAPAPFPWRRARYILIRQSERRAGGIRQMVRQCREDDHDISKHV